MNKILFFLFFCHYFISSVSADDNNLIGVWLNLDNKTRGVTRIVIDDNGSDGYLVNTHGKCHPDDCNWGVAKLDHYGGLPFDVNYERFDYKTVRVRVDQLSDNILTVTVSATYYDSRRDSYEFSYFMYKDNSVLIPIRQVKY